MRPVRRERHWVLGRISSLFARQELRTTSTPVAALQPHKPHKAPHCHAVRPGIRHAGGVGGLWYAYGSPPPAPYLRLTAGVRQNAASGAQVQGPWSTFLNTAPTTTSPGPPPARICCTRDDGPAAEGCGFETEHGCCGVLMQNAPLHRRHPMIRHQHDLRSGPRLKR